MDPSISPGDNVSLGRSALVIVVLTLIALAPAAALPWVGPAVAWGLVAACAFAIGLLSPRSWLPLLALSTLVGALIVGSLLVAAAARYMPMAIVSGAFAVSFIRSWRVGRIRVARPPLAVAVALAIYVAWASVTTVVSSDVGTSVTYLAGMVGALGLAFVLAPSALPGREGLHRVATTVALLAVFLALASVVLTLLGPLGLFERYVGLYLITEVDLAGRPTGLIVPRATGVFAAPATQSLALAAGLVALVALRGGIRGPRRLAALGLGVAIVTSGLILTMARVGWLAAAAGCATLAIIAFARRRPDGWATAIVALLLGLVAALTLDIIAVEPRFDIALARYGENLAETLPGNAQVSEGSYNTATTQPTSTGDDTAIRGGTSLSGRLAIWLASSEAIMARPVFGWGLGTNPGAIGPYLGGANTGYRGLTSHNTWLRTAVETGLPGLATFTGVLLAVAWRIVRAGKERTNRASRQVAFAFDPAALALVGVAVALLAAQAFETLLLGGLNYPSFVWVLALGLFVAVAPVLTEHRQPAVPRR